MTLPSPFVSALIAVCVTLVACGGPTGTTTPPPPPPWATGSYGGGGGGGRVGGGSASGGAGDAGTSTSAPDPSGDTEIDFALRSWKRVESAEGLPNTYGALVIDIALEATVVANAQQTVFTGTLAQSAAGTWTYSPIPSDSLVLSTSSGETATIRFLAVSGSLDSGKVFMDGDHELSFELTSSDESLSVTSTSTEHDLKQSVKGVRPFDGVSCTIDVSRQKAFSGYTSGSGHEAGYTGDLVGNLNCGSEVLSFTEASEWEFLSGTKFDGSSIYLDNLDRTLNHTWTRGATTYRMPKAEISRYVNADGPQGYFASGDILRDGVAVGRLETEKEVAEGGTIVRAYLVMPDGRHLLGTEVLVKKE